MSYYAAGYTLTFPQIFDLVYHLCKKAYKREEFNLALDYLYNDLLLKYDGVDIHDLEDAVEPTILIVCLSSTSPISTDALLDNQTATNIRSYLNRACIKPYKAHVAGWKAYPG